jgi:hypothetical protein
MTGFRETQTIPTLHHMFSRPDISTKVEDILGSSIAYSFFLFQNQNPNQCPMCCHYNLWFVALEGDRLKSFNLLSLFP